MRLKHLPGSLRQCFAADRAGEAEQGRNVVRHILRTLHRVIIYAQLRLRQRVILCFSPVFLPTFFCFCPWPGAQRLINSVFQRQNTALPHHLLHFQLHLVLLLNFHRQHNGGQRCQPRVKQISFYRKFFMPQDFFYDLRKFFFQKAHRPRCLPAGLLLGNRSRKRPFIHLHILIQGDSVDLHNGGRHHIRRLFFHNKIPEFLDSNGIFRHQVGGDGFSSRRRIIGCNRNILNAWKSADHSLHLRQFNPKSPDLHLSVSPAHKLNISVRQKPHIISGVVNTLIPFPVGKTIGSIYFCRLLRPVQIAFAYLIAGHAQFSHSPGRESAHLLIHHIHFQIIQRPANGNIFILSGFVHRINRCQYRTFRGAIAIIKLKIRCRPDRHQRLTAGQQVLQTVILHLQGKLTPHLRGHKRMRHLFLYQIFI